MSREVSLALVEKHQEALQLTSPQFKRWAGKRYIVLIGLEEVEPLAPFPIDKSNFGNMDDWLAVEEIERVMIAAA